MKHLRRSMTWMHTWTGLLFGWVLYFIFVTGSLAYFDIEIDRWMHPEWPSPVEVDDSAALLQTAYEYASWELPDADRYMLRVPTVRAYTPFIEVFLTGRDSSGQAVNEFVLLQADGQEVPNARDTFGGQGLYRMHWTFQYIPEGIGEIIAVVAAFFMLMAIVSGVITHKKIFADFFMLRLGKGQRSWLDAHNAFSVVSLPYQFVITFSGLIFSGTAFVAPIVAVQYGLSEAGQERAALEMYGELVAGNAATNPSDLVALRPLIDETQVLFGEEPVTMLIISDPNTADARISVHGTIAGGVLRDTPQVSFNGVTGERLDTDLREFVGSESIIDVLKGIHEALFAGPLLRWLFFLSGLMGAGMVSTGLVLWVRKRFDPSRSIVPVKKNIEIIDKVNVGVIAGLPIGIASYFWLNRLLPLNLANRAEWEMNGLFLVWLLVIVVALARAPRYAWSELFAVGGVAFLSLPLLNALTTDQHLGNSLTPVTAPSDPTLASVDLTMLVVGLVFSVIGWRARKTALQSQIDSTQKVAATPLVLNRHVQ